MLNETDVVGERSFAELIHDDAISFAAFGGDHEFWRSTIYSVVRPMLYDIANAFLPFIAGKFGQDLPDTINFQVHRLMCLQAENSFIEHTPHSHSAAPNWVFTFPLYLDDRGRDDRGTSLYRVSESDLFETADRVLLNDFLTAKTEEAVRAPFKQGALLAFYDSPLSLHGSTPFHSRGENSSRRILRGHISLGPREVELIYSATMEELNAEFAQLVSKGISPRGRFPLDRDIGLMRAFTLGEVPRLPKKVRVLFPALSSHE